MRSTPRRPPVRRRRQSPDARIAAYEAQKFAWDAAHPGADYRTRDRAMRRIARAVGV